MMSICFKEKLKIKPETLSEIVSSTNQDIRLVLNHLSMLAAKGDGDLENATKHVKLVSIFHRLFCAV
jgi:replication factor C subunit 1